MFRSMCKSKIHRARVTDANLNYEGSFSIDKDLMEAADLYEYEKVQVLNINTGARAETYVIEGRRGSGEMCANGALARLVQPGDLVIIVAYGLYGNEELLNFKPKIVLVDEHNKIKSIN